VRREPAPARTRRANLGRGFEEAAIHHGPSLRPGDAVRSPAVIEETFTTIAVYPGWQAVVDEAGDYRLERPESSSRGAGRGERGHGGAGQPSGSRPS
jgi:N-methylhydantoinase A/oxoprolinase/acetone carboxylase beta subunit